MSEQTVNNCIVPPTFDTSHYDIISGRGIANVMIGVLLFTIFLSIFYFTYIAKVEGEIVEEQVDNTVRDMLQSLKDSGFDLSTVKTAIKAVPLPNMEEADKQVKENNDALLKQAGIVLGIATIIVIVLIGLLKTFTNFSIVEILKINGIILIFVAITEFIFINFISRKYRSLDPNRVKRIILEQIRDF